MIRRLKILSLLLLSVAGIFAGPLFAATPQRIYFPAIKSLADSVAFLPVAPGAESVTVEIRFSMPGLRLSSGESSRSISIIWNYVDSANFTSLNLSYGRNHFDDTMRPTYAALSVIDRREGSDSVLWTKKIESDFTTPVAENALAVTLTPNKNAELSFGHPRPEPVGDAPTLFDSSLPVAVGAVGEASIGLAVADLTLPDATVSALPVYTPEQLDVLTDGAEPASPIGYWQYLDRDTDPLRAAPGGQYQLAIVPTDEGAYNIVYLSGAEVGANSWTPGMVKAVLTPTPFANHYNLTWIDAHHTPHTRELHATLDPTNAILTLSFPLLNSTLRFYRLK